MEVVVTILDAFQSSLRSIIIECFHNRVIAMMAICSDHLEILLKHAAPSRLSKCLSQ